METFVYAPPPPGPLPVLYEDDWFAVVDKPAGIDTNGNKRRTLENALPFNLKASTSADAARHEIVSWSFCDSPNCGRH